MRSVPLAAPAFTAPVALRSMSDAALAQRLAQGDRRVLDEIYARHVEPLRRYARRFLEPAAAEDAVHDALAGTQVALLGAGRVVELRPWLFRCVRNACLSELARAGRRCGEVPEDVMAAGGADACDVVLRNERLHDALQGLARLPERQREALRRRAIDGEGYDAVAARLDVTENAAVQLVHRARRSLLALVA
jgi:RNA polymerase sigma-70 factor (ECF subfamily)